MVTLLKLPRELREQILREIIFIQSPLPASPSVSSDRTCLRNTVDPYWAVETNIYVERRLTDNTQMALLQTNRQIRTETQELLRRLEETPYHLDVMFVKECGMLPTWCSFPGRRRRIDTVHVQFRIFEPPKDINLEWLESAYFQGDDGGSTRTSWNIIFLLTVFLLNGVDDIPVHINKTDTAGGFEASNEFEETDLEIGPTASAFYNKMFARHTIKNLILDVLAPSQNIHTVIPGPDNHLLIQQPRRNVFGHSIFQYSDEFVGNYWHDFNGAGDGQIGPAHKVAFSLWQDITLGACLNFPYELYSQLLCECVGTIEIRVNGVPWDKIDMTATLCGAFGTVLPSDCSLDETQSTYPEQFVRAVAKRKRDKLWNEEEYERLRVLWT